MPTARPIDRRTFLSHTAALAAAGLYPHSLFAAPEPLTGTKLIDWDGDLARRMVDGLHAFLDRETAASVEKRKQFWKPDYSSVDAYLKSVAPNRERLKKILGVVDARVQKPRMHVIATTDQSALVGETNKFKVLAVRWPVLDNMDGEGLLLEPLTEMKGPSAACAVVLPDADWTPEMFVGFEPGVEEKAQFPRLLAERGVRVIIPALIDRKDSHSGNPKLGRMTNQPHREFIYRMAYEVGRTVVGYELQKVFAAIDWFCADDKRARVGVFGYGEGGLLAFFAGALDDRIRATAACGYFGPREGLADEPIYRNAWGLLREFGDAEVGAFLLGELEAGATGRLACLGDNPHPVIAGPPTVRDGRSGAAPGKLQQADDAAVDKEYKRMTAIAAVPQGTFFHRPMFERRAANGQSMYQLPEIVEQFCKKLVVASEHPSSSASTTLEIKARERRYHSDPSVRSHRQFDQLVEHTQRLVRQADTRRQEFFWSKLNLKSLDDYRKSTAPLRDYFWEEIIGKLPAPEMPANPRTRPLHDTPKWNSYEVTLDLYPDVFAYGILTVPKDLKDGEKRPVVVCQHGLEGRPTLVVNPKEKTNYYNSFGSALADRGFVVFAPQNPYIFQNHFRQVVRKAHPLKLSLYAFIVRQHERILDWLATLPFVDEKRMGFYGLSYGGKTAMRIPAILEKYCLSICSGDFNEWIWKNTSVDFRGSYMFTGEYDMYEFDLGNTFNYAEMAALIAPRPFMVERGHDDGVGIDEWVAYEYAKVRRLYAKLGIPERTTIEFFNGGHECHNVGTFAFLHKHLNWPEPA
jgi:dienelactone hydrolase